MPVTKANEMLDALNKKDIWLYLAWQDIRLRYRRSKIGPFWITLSMAIFVVTLGVVYSQLFKVDIEEYLPFLAAGFVVWTFISGFLGECPNAIVDSANYIKDIKINPLVIILRLATRHVIILGHNVLIILGIYLYFGLNPGLTATLALPGLIVVLLNLFAIGVSLSVIGTRFRDVAPIIQSLIQVLFFITPIMWFPRLVPEGSWLIFANPFTYFLDLIRTPLLGTAPNTSSWLVAILTLVVFSGAASGMYCFKAKRIPFWV